MCYIDLEPCEVWNEAARKARKEHKCACCERTIRKGETYLVHFSVFEGDATSEKMCDECDTDRVTFGDNHGGVRGSPGYFKVMLADCIAEDGEERWKEMMDSIKARKHQCHTT